ncbi:MAG: hypothetical protein UIC63_05480 [Bacteroidaceae bacterium]|nr:hypothetical protein [Bacteroidaceae bacterium]
MNEKLNLAEILKDCPKGTKLWSPLCGECEFDSLNMGTIICKKQNAQEITFTSGGYYMIPVFDNCECVIFPSKDQRDWSKFQRTFKDGDVIYVSTRRNSWVSIFKNDTEYQIFSYTDLNLDNNNFYGSDKETMSLCLHKAILEKRFATEEEKEKLFQAIKEHGYTWNAETKTLEEEKKDKFDPATLKPFDQVLVRNVLTDKWRIGFFEKIDTEEPKYDTAFSSYRHCIPYNDETKHLLGKAEMEPEYYRVDEYLL